MKHALSLEKAKANLEEILEAVAEGEAVSVQVANHEVTLVDSETFGELTRKAARVESEMEMLSRLREAMMMTFTVPEGEQAELDEARTLADAVRAELYDEAKRTIW